MNDWKIQSRAHACQACEKPFADKQSYHTVLSDEKRDFVRLDVCEPCWQAQYSQGATERKGFISHWQGVYEAPAAAAPDAIQKDTAESLLRKLMELNDPQYAPTCFILAVMLERKRVLKVKEQFRREGQRVIVYEQPKTGDIFTVPDPNLQLNQLEQVQHDVAHLLEHGLPQEIQPPAAPPQPTEALPGEAAAASPEAEPPASEDAAPAPVAEGETAAPAAAEPIVAETTPKD